MDWTGSSLVTKTVNLTGGVVTSLLSANPRRIWFSTVGIPRVNCGLSVGSLNFPFQAAGEVIPWDGMQFITDNTSTDKYISYNQYGGLVRREIKIAAVGATAVSVTECFADCGTFTSSKHGPKDCVAEPHIFRFRMPTLEDNMQLLPANPRRFAVLWSFSVAFPCHISFGSSINNSTFATLGASGFPPPISYYHWGPMVKEAMFIRSTGGPVGSGGSVCELVI